MTMQLQELIDTLTALLPVAGPTADTGIQYAPLRVSVGISYPKDTYANYRDRDIKRVRSFFVEIENAQPPTTQYDVRCDIGKTSL